MNKIKFLFNQGRTSGQQNKVFVYSGGLLGIRGAAGAVGRLNICQNQLTDIILRIVHAAQLLDDSCVVIPVERKAENVVAALAALLDLLKPASLIFLGGLTVPLIIVLK